MITGRVKAILDRKVVTNIVNTNVFKYEVFHAFREGDDIIGLNKSEDNYLNLVFTKIGTDTFRNVHTLEVGETMFFLKLEGSGNTTTSLNGLVQTNEVTLNDYEYILIVKVR